MKFKKKKSIFIIDDDADILELSSALLLSAGFNVTQSVSPLRSISKIKSLKPDYLVTDLVMSGMDGLELCKFIRQEKTLNKMKIVLMTARTDKLWWQRAASLGADGYIQKPINIKNFVDYFRNDSEPRPEEISPNAMMGFSNSDQGLAYC